MKARSYNRELKKATAQMLDIFNDIVISRYDKNMVPQQNISVPCIFGNRSRMIKSVENRNNTVPLPMCVLSLKGMSRDSTRAISINDGLFGQTGDTGYNHLLNTPVPYNFDYTLDIIARYMDDIDQIVSNFATFFNPDVYVVLPNPRKPGEYIKPQVVFNGDVGFDFPEEIDANTQERIVATCTFTFKTWLFPGLESDTYEGKIIKKINFTPNMYYDNDGYGHLNAFYSVPYTMTLDEYQENIVCGYIKAPHFDWLPISAGVSGYFYEISAQISGSVHDVNISGNNVYVTDEYGGYYILGRNGYLSEGMLAISTSGYADLLNGLSSGHV